MGAKSTCTYVETPDIKVVIDPGVAIMQPSFPAYDEQKHSWVLEAREMIEDICKKADVLTISHYHHDHYFHDSFDIYGKKDIFVKNPNMYINMQQRERSVKFFNDLGKHFRILKDEYYETEKQEDFPNPLDDLHLAMSKDFGDYTKRRKEVISKGEKRFTRQVKEWNGFSQVPEIHSDKIQVSFAEGKTISYGNTKLTFTMPLFHGIEFAGVGWVYAIIIEYGGKKLFYSSDVSGPIIEDYAELIVKESPSHLILDGPTTYLFGYILNRINLQRCIDNAIHIITNLNTEVIIYDHHLTRESKFREHTKNVWNTAEKEGKKVVTAAEFLGSQTVVERVG